MIIFSLRVRNSPQKTRPASILALKIITILLR